MFEEFGNGFTLLGFDAVDVAAASFEAAAPKLRIPFRIVRDDRTGSRERYEATLVLVRPDQFVAWTADDVLAGPASVLARVMGHGTTVNHETSANVAGEIG